VVIADVWQITQRNLEGALIATGFPYRENLRYADPYLAMMKTVMAQVAVP